MELTERQREVLGLMAEGLSSKEIAERIFKTLKTVESHKRALYKRLGAKHGAHAVNIGWERGILGGSGFPQGAVHAAEQRS